MQNTRAIAQGILWVGGGDRRLARFENLFPLENGVTYNAFVVLDEKTALLDTVDNAISHQFIDNLTAALAGRPLDYLVIHHMEPDHCANLMEIQRLYPGVTLVGNAKTFQLMERFYGASACARREVKEGDTLSLGRRTLRFFSAPMVHWPEVMFTCEEGEGILFSADAFGAFGGYTGHLFSDETDYAGRYMEEARRYYANIVGKFGAQVQSALKKLAGLPLRMMCPLHGPMLRGDDIALMMDKYQKWSLYEPESAGVLMPYASMYGNTESAVNMLADMLAERGVRDICPYDVSKTHYSTIAAAAFEHSHWVLAAPTYNMGLFGPMETLLRDMKALNLQNRKVAIVGNGSWAPASHTIMREMVLEMKGMDLLSEPLVIESAVKPAQRDSLSALADVIAASVKEHGG